MDMIGPYCLANWWRVRWGRLPNIGRLPIIGKPRGPGGSTLRWRFEVVMIHQSAPRRRKARVNAHANILCFRVSGKCVNLIT